MCASDNVHLLLTLTLACVARVQEEPAAVFAASALAPAAGPSLPAASPYGTRRAQERAAAAAAAASAERDKTPEQRAAEAAEAAARAEARARAEAEARQPPPPPARQNRLVSGPSRRQRLSAAPDAAAPQSGAHAWFGTAVRADLTFTSLKWNVLGHFSYWAWLILQPGPLLNTLSFYAGLCLSGGCGDAWQRTGCRHGTLDRHIPGGARDPGCEA